MKNEGLIEEMEVNRLLAALFTFSLVKNEGLIEDQQREGCVLQGVEFSLVKNEGLIEDFNKGDTSGQKGLVFPREERGPH